MSDLPEGLIAGPGRDKYDCGCAIGNARDLGQTEVSIRKKIPCRFHAKRIAESEVARIEEQYDPLIYEKNAQLDGLESGKKRFWNSLRKIEKARSKLLRERNQLENERRQSILHAWDVYREQWGNMAY